MKLGRRETVRRALRALRANAGISQLDVAERIGIPEKRYWRIENGYETPDDKLIGKLSKALGTTAEHLPFTPTIEAQAS